MIEEVKKQYKYLVQARIRSLFGYKVVLRYKGKDIPLDLQKGEEFIYKIINNK